MLNALHELINQTYFKFALGFMAIIFLGVFVSYVTAEFDEIAQADQDIYAEYGIGDSGE